MLRVGLCRGGSSSGGAPRSRLEVPGIVGGSEDLVVALPVPGIDGDVGLPKYHRACLPEAGDGCGVLLGDVVREPLRPGGGADAGHLEAVLDGYRDAMEGAQDLASPEGFVSCYGLGDGLVLGECDDGVEGRVMSLDASYDVLREFQRGYPAIPDRLDCLREGCEC
jgi:hypothetical protein